MTQSQALSSLAKHEREHTPEQYKRKGSIMRTLAIAILVLMIGAAFALAKPDRKDEPKQPSPPPIFRLPAECQYGTITMTGKAISIEGPVWTARGEVRADSSIYLLWTERATDRVAPSVYRVEGAPPPAIVGRWGFAPEAFVNDAGEMDGSHHGDRIFKVEPPPIPDN